MCFSVIQSKFFYQYTCSSIDKFLVRQLHVHHFVSFYAAQLNHDAGGNHVENQFLPCARLHAAASGNKFWSDHHFDCYVGFGCHWASGVTGDAGSEDAVCACFMQSTHDVRRGARCGNANDNIFVCHIVFSQFLPAASGVVFCFFYRIAQRAIPSGDEADDQRGGMPKVGGISEASSTPNRPLVPAPI